MRGCAVTEGLIEHFHSTLAGGEGFILSQFLPSLPLVIPSVHFLVFNLH